MYIATLCSIIMLLSVLALGSSRTNGGLLPKASSGFRRMRLGSSSSSSSGESLLSGGPLEMRGSILLNYSFISKRSEKLFVYAGRSNSNSSEVIEVMMVGKSVFGNWSKEKAFDNTTLGVFEALGSPLNKYPGTKLVAIPSLASAASSSSSPNTASAPLSISHVAFFDDEAPVGRLNLDALFSSLKQNKTYAFVDSKRGDLSQDLADKLCLGYALKSYKFEHFKKPTSSSNYGSTSLATIQWPKNANKQRVLTLARAHVLMKDLVDSPALNLGPKELAAVAKDVATECDAEKVLVLDGVDELVAANYPQIAAVGMAAAQGRDPQLVDFSWLSATINASSLPEIVIIGKGVTFDTGGLNIKSGGGMRQMKKDMAGAAQALALAYSIMALNLPCKLRCLIPIAENSIAGVALRPGDVIRARNNKTTEITNTDAEGRLILADCLVAACEGAVSPALVVNFATLTGAARMALGADLPALFSNDQDAQMELFHLSHSPNVSDPLWPLPLWEPMRNNLKSSVADLVNAADGGAGAITAALYLSEFISSPPSPSSAAEVSTSDAASTAAAEDNKSADSSSASSSSSSSSSGPIVKRKKNTPLWFHIDAPADKMGAKALLHYIQHVVLKDIK